MTALARADRAKLAKLLALLGSDQAGEVAAAGAAAHRFVQQRGLDWCEILQPLTIEAKPPELGTWRTTTAACLARPSSLRPWELRFLSDLPGFRRLSVKRRYVLSKIAARVLKTSPQ